MPWLTIANNSAQLNNTSSWTATSGSLLVSNTIGTTYNYHKFARDKYFFFANAAANWYQDVTLNAEELALVASGTKKIVVAYARCRYGSNAATMRCGLRIEALNASNVVTQVYDDVANPGPTEDVFYTVEATGVTNIPADTTKIRIRQIYQDDSIIDAINVGIEGDGPDHVTSLSTEVIMSDPFLSETNVSSIVTEPMFTTASDSYVSELSSEAVFTLPSDTYVATYSTEVLASNYVYPAHPTGDDHYDKVISLLHFDGTDGDVSTPDFAYNRLWYFNASAQIDTAQSKFGGSSLYLPPGTNSFIRTGYPELQFPAAFFRQLQQDCCVEFWFRPNALGRIHTLLANRHTNNWRGWRLQVLANNTVQFAHTDNDTDVQFSATSAATITTGWNHIVLEKLGAAVFLYVNGNVVQTTVAGSPSTVSGDWLIIGARHTEDTTQCAEGWFDEFRITVGRARYTGYGVYSEPVAAFPSAGITPVIPSGWSVTGFDAQAAITVDSNYEVSGLDFQIVHDVPSAYDVSGLDIQIVFSARVVPDNKIHFQVLRY